jgi:hypothetical protein
MRTVALRNIWLRLWVLPLMLGAAPALTAQEVRGRLVTELDSTPIPQALILLLDETERERSRTAPTPSGGFTLRAPAPGRYHIRVQRIGQRGWQTPAFNVSAGEISNLTLRAPDAPFQLLELEAQSRRPRCGVTLGDASLGAAVLEAAQTALGLAEAEAARGQRNYVTESYRRTVPDYGLVNDPEITSGQLSGWPIQSADPDSLRLKGFVQGEWPAPNLVGPGSPIVGPTYYAPDARVLFADWFLETHCLVLDTITDQPDSRKALVARFSPAKGTRAAAALKGQLLFDRTTMSLRLLSFEFVARPSWARRGSAGGELRFAQLPDGAWVPATWQLRVPLPRLVAHRFRFFGVEEVGGRVTSVRRLDGQPDREAEDALSRLAPGRRWTRIQS